MRKAMAADVAELARLHAEAFPDPWDEAAFAGLLEGQGTWALLTPDSFILIRALAGEAEVLTLAVTPAARRQGLGRTLMEAGADAARAAGAETIFLEAAADNEAALALYASVGFEPVGRRPGYYRRHDGPPMDALVLRRTLTASAA